MNSDQEPAIFDGHNDVLLKMYRNTSLHPEQQFVDGDEGHLDMPRMRQGGFGGGMFAIFVPTTTDKTNTDKVVRYEKMQQASYELPIPAQIPQNEALPVVMSMAGILMRCENASEGQAKICHTGGDVHNCFEQNKLAMIMHMEGAEAIDSNFYALEVLHQAGLRSIGPVWSRPTDFAHGVPFKFPSSPDTGPGLTDLGKALVKACNELKIVIDLSHMNEKGFWDVEKHTDAPLIATHSNAHALTPHTRNLTDEQLAAIKASDGMVGVNFATAFLRPDGQMHPDTSLDIVIAHLDYLIEKLGVDRVGFGSDFDGAVVPDEIGDVTGLNRLRARMVSHGYDNATMKKLCHENWINALKRTFGK